MTATITDVNGKTHKLEDVDKIEFVDVYGNTIYEGNYGDTIQYQQGGQIKEKKLTESRRMLQFMDGFAEGNYSYMPKTLGDVVQGASLEMMTDSVGWTVGKAGCVVLGGVGGLLLGGPAGAALGASWGAILANLGGDAIKLYSAYGQAPDTFWSKYLDSLQSISRGADSDQEEQATGLRRVISEMGTGASYVGMGGKAAVYETWDDIIGAVPTYTAANVLGNLTRAVAAGVGGRLTYVIDQGFNDAFREGARITGITNDIMEATKIGAFYGAVGGGTAWGFAKLALANKGWYQKLLGSSPFLGNPIANGIEAAASQGLYDAVAHFADPTEADRDISDYGLDVGMAFATGYLMSALPATFKKFKFKDAENAAAGTTEVVKDTTTVKEAVENKVIVQPENTPLASKQLTTAEEEYRANQSLERFIKRQAREKEYGVPEVLPEGAVSTRKTGHTFLVVEGNVTKGIPEAKFRKIQQERYQREYYKTAKEKMLTAESEIAKRRLISVLEARVEGMQERAAAREKAIEAARTRSSTKKIRKAQEEINYERKNFEGIVNALDEYKAEREAEERFVKMRKDAERRRREREYAETFSTKSYQNYYNIQQTKVEEDVLRALGFGALGDDFVESARTQLRRDAVEAIYQTLPEGERNNIAKYLGYDSFDSFAYETPLADLMEWNKEIVKIYNLPVFNPRVFQLTPQDAANVKRSAIGAINAGVQPDIAVYRAFTKVTRNRPAPEQVAAILDELPSPILSMEDFRKRKAQRLVQFMDERTQYYLNEDSGFDFLLTPAQAEEVKAARVLEESSNNKDKGTKK